MILLTEITPPPNLPSFTHLYMTKDDAMSFISRKDKMKLLEDAARKTPAQLTDIFNSYTNARNDENLPQAERDMAGKKAAIIRKVIDKRS